MTPSLSYKYMFKVMKAVWLATRGKLIPYEHANSSYDAATHTSSLD